MKVSWLKNGPLSCDSPSACQNIIMDPSVSNIYMENKTKINASWIKNIIIIIMKINSNSIFYIDDFVSRIVL